METTQRLHTRGIRVRCQTLVPSKLGGQKNKLAPFSATWSAKWVGENKCQQAANKVARLLKL